jgi:hypothetical protein
MEMTDRAGHDSCLSEAEGILGGLGSVAATAETGFRTGIPLTPIRMCCVNVARIALTGPDLTDLAWRSGRSTFNASIRRVGVGG